MAEEGLPFGLARARLEEVARSRPWLLLLHARPRLLGGYVSEADSPEFFLDPFGSHDPYRELIATLRAFAESRRVGPLMQPAQCAYPERHRFLVSALGPVGAQPPCPELEEWRSRLKARSLTLVFASSYLGNPASAFGHTFLRFDSFTPEARSKKNDLLDHGVSFAAHTGQDGGLRYAVLGLVGGYPGYFSFLPYFLKVAEYNNGESRDLWEYRLGLTEEQVRRVVDHLWEIRLARFDYYFLDENCSYQLLSLLEVGRPDWRLTDSWGVWVIPADTIRRVSGNPGAIAEVRFRPSLHRRLSRALAELRDDERADFFRLVSEGAAVRGGESAAALDAALDFREYRSSLGDQVPDDAERGVRHALLVARSKLGAPRVAAEIAAPLVRPDAAHRTRKVAIYGGASGGEPVVGIQVRPAYHDLLDGDGGHLPFSEIEVGRLDIRYHPRSPRLSLGGFELIRAGVLTPFGLLSRDYSWRISSGLRPLPRTEAPGCEGCLAFNVSAGAGFAFEVPPLRERLLAYGLAHGRVDASRAFDHGFRVAPVLEAGAIVRVREALRFQLLAEYRVLGSFGVSGRGAFSAGRDWEIRIEGSRLSGSDSEAEVLTLALGHYF